LITNAERESFLNLTLKYLSFYASYLYIYTIAKNDTRFRYGIVCGAVFDILWVVILIERL